ncbi:DNA-damage-inducible membrane protein [Salmonella enterica subsp. enterica]|uniref:DNA-damage-inducible membrane protein n=1 Tax=Salmonella enterica I TaxID=59201 RepID=A0A447TPY5_SALET|nr:DNA-damage-inducible membrane protein [Salmonella enterica subsp. enterica]
MAPKNPQALARALIQPLLLALGAGVMIVLFRTPLIELALHIVGGNDAVLVQARRFLEIRWLSAPASLANLVLLGWLLGVQYARAPVILLVVGNILNIALDLWLVMGLHMNVQGAALATVIAEYVTLLIGLMMVRKVLPSPRCVAGYAKTGLARQRAPPFGAQSRYHAALIAPSALFWRNHGVRRAAGQRYYRGKCSP